MSVLESPVSQDARRLRALDALGLISTPPEEEFEALAALAADLLSCPTGLVALIDGDTWWPRAANGVEIPPGPRQDTLCEVTIGQPDALMIGDAAADPRFTTNAYVVDGLRAYAGIAISAPDPDGGRVPVGAVCVCDIRPRQFTAADEAVLAHLRTLAEALFDARALRVRAEQQAEALRRSDRTFRQAERLAEMGSWRLELESETLHWSDGVYRVYDLEVGSAPPLSDAMSFFPEYAHATVAGSLASTIESGAPFDIEVDFISAKGAHRRVRSLGELELIGGRPAAVVGVFQDITERHKLEQSLRRSASVDELTRIANRAAFNAHLDRAMATARDAGSPLELLLIDLDRFKAVNDAHGHLAGDDVLRAFGRRLRRIEPDEAFAARLGGDEFALLLCGDAAHRADAVVRRLLVELRMPVHSSAGVIPVSGTIGHATLLADESARSFVHRADTALYQAKRIARGTACAWGQLRLEDRRDEEVRAA